MMEQRITNFDYENYERKCKEIRTVNNLIIRMQKIRLHFLGDKGRSTAENEQTIYYLSYDHIH